MTRCGQLYPDPYPDIRNSEKTLTWNALQNRRNEAIERLPVRSVVEEIS